MSPWTRFVLNRARLGLGLWIAFTTLPAEVIVDTPGLSARPLPPVASNPDGPRFELLSTDRTGVDFRYRWNQTPYYERLFNSSAVGAGVAAGDYDGDGWPDLCMTRPSGGACLYRNLGGFRFTNVTERAGLRTGGTWTTGASFVDLNNDGHPDLFLCSYDAPNQVYMNRGDGTFEERGQASGLNFNGASLMMAFGDYDRDGDLDGYLLTGGLIPKPAQRFRVQFVDGRPVVPRELEEYWQIFYLPGERAAAAEAGQFDHLFRNNGDGTFTDVSRAAGISGCDFGNAALWWDVNADGWPDLYIANDYFGPDRLYRNNRDGTFTDVTASSLPRTPWTSMGADAGDINNDGRLDLIASDMSGTTHFKRLVDMGDQAKSGWFLELPEPRQYLRNAVYLHTGTERFLEAAYLLGIADTDWSWSVLFGDLDDDGWLDLFVANGMTRDWMDNDLAAQTRQLSPPDAARFWREQPVRADRNLAFRNRGDLRFEPMAVPWGLDFPGPSFGAALVDLDADGRLDLVVNDFERPARLYRNRGTENHRIQVRLSGTSNRYGVGASVRLDSIAGVQTRYLTLAHGFMSASEPIAHFGLGPVSTVHRLTIEWPSGHRQTFDNLPADRVYSVQEPTGLAARQPAPAPAPTWLVPSPVLAAARHEAVPDDDFKHQPLLPWKLSTPGPGMAWGDVDGDDIEELYVTGNPTHPGGLYRQSPDGTFRRDPESGLSSVAEEVAPLFFEANGDGRLDLLVASAGIDHDPNRKTFPDRLYYNDGRGRFTPAPSNAWPDRHASAGTAVAADLDRDGDLDLFVGSRLLPGQYPLTPDSFLLRNEAGRFTEVADTLAPGLKQAGLVTAALWSDADNDGWLDLLVTCAWGPVRYFHQEQGRLIERTREAGLANRLGWWNGIAGADINHDGAIDYVVSNLGLNTRYQPTPDHPCRLYAADFAGSGAHQLIEALVTSDGIWPLRGKAALEQAVPRLAEAFPTHRQFASAPLPELLGAAALDQAGRLEMNTLDSGVLLNDGRGFFAFHPLPRLAQIAPAFGVIATDLDGDGLIDLCLAQNFYGPQRETGRMNGGVGLVLAGLTNGTFAPLWPAESGFVVPGDARSLTVTDLNRDRWPDLAVGLHDGAMQAFVSRPSSSNRVLTVRLIGSRGNPTAVGARVTLHLKSGAARTAEIHAGSGYLSQSTPVLTFGLGTTHEPHQVDVRWPQGQATSHPVPPGSTSLGVSPYY